MIRRAMISRIAVLTAGLFLLCGIAAGQQGDKSAGHPASTSASASASAGGVTPSSTANSAPAASARDDEAARLEGEKRFATNCGRCHQSPHKLQPRMMATIVRHMRVRASLTDEDMRLILRYMTQ
jgi:mono/diheme cytochrome c family protein